MRIGQRTGRVSRVPAKDIEAAWQGKFAKPGENKIFSIILSVLEKNGEVYAGLVAPQLGCDSRSAGAFIGAMVKERLIKEVEKRRINGKSVQIYIGYNDKPSPKVKHNEERPIAEILAEIEEMAEQSDVCDAAIMASFKVNSRLARDYIEKLVRMKVLQKNGTKYIDGAWRTMYQIYVAPPRQESLMNSKPAVRDSLVAALFGSTNRDPEAAWVF